MAEQLILSGKQAEVRLLAFQQNTPLECICDLEERDKCQHRKHFVSESEAINLDVGLVKVAIRNITNNILIINSCEWQAYWLFDATGRHYQSYPLCERLNKKHFLAENYKRPGFHLKAGDMAFFYLIFQAIPNNVEADELKLIIGQEFFDFKLRANKTMGKGDIKAVEESDDQPLPLTEIAGEEISRINHESRRSVCMIYDPIANLSKEESLVLPPFHQILLAHELTLKRASNDMRKMESPLSSAIVDLNPHQIDAGLFAFRGPMSKGAILCDEVGLGKTIEAGLIICQLWAEGKRKIIVLVPASIRKQWQNELLEKFEIPCVIVDGFEYRLAKKSGRMNPFDRDEVVIVSIPFAAMKAAEIAAVGKLDLVVIDEAHRLRNVYKKSGSKQAKKLKEIFYGLPKILLTATPLQNSLMELYGLVSFIDERIFGSEYAFRAKFTADREGRESENLELLKERISAIATRTIRRQVQEYVPYTNRISLIEDFTPTYDELRLYDLVSEYLQRPEVAAIATRQRHLMILIYRKILASSSFAIVKTLQGLASNIENRINDLDPGPIDELISDVEGYEEEKEEIAKREDGEPLEDDEQEQKSPEAKETFTLEQLQDEKKELLSMKNLAESIRKNAKGDALIIALEKAFSHAKKLGWNEKAVIFTESRRTQEYLLRLLAGNGYAEQVTIFNGTNESPIAKRAYALWEKERTKHEGEGLLSKVAVIREALIHEFKNHTKIMITTEAGAEGINLQFCNIVINYDLPWNPQRVEQRIGRCHRYGQKSDVVVLNFLNRANAADQRVFELLDKKFRLFNGVFGASDEILGSIGSGIDFEKRILEIYQSCRTELEINSAFDRLQEELAEQINQKMVETRGKLLEHFDDEVRARFKIINKRVKEDLSAIDMMLARLIISALNIKNFEMKESACNLQISSIPEYLTEASKDRLMSGHCYIGRYDENSKNDRIHIGHPIAKAVIKNIKNSPPDKVYAVKLCYSKGNHKISQLEPYVGRKGVWLVYKLAYEGLDTEEHLLHIVFVKDNDGWLALDQELSQKLPNIMAEEMDLNEEIELPDENMLEAAMSGVLKKLSEKISIKNEEYYDAEFDKLEIYSEEVLMRLYDELKEKEEELKNTKRIKDRAMTFEDRQKARKEIHKLELAYGHLVDKMAQEKKRLFEEKDKEMKKLEKKLNLKIQKTCIARALWLME